MDNPDNNLSINFEERGPFARAWSSVTKAVGEMAIISVAVPAVFRIFSKEHSIGELVKAAWVGPTSWLTYGLVGITAGLKYRRESDQDKETLRAHIENAVHKEQLRAIGQKPSDVSEIKPHDPLQGSQHQTESAPLAESTPDTTTELAHTQQALANTSHALEVATNQAAGLEGPPASHAAKLAAPVESHVEQAIIDKAAAEQATATIH